MVHIVYQQVSNRKPQLFVCISMGLILLVRGFQFALAMEAILDFLLHYLMVKRISIYT